MNGKDLILGLSYISPKYIAEAETDTVTAKTPGKYAGTRRRPLGRAILIAAVIALMLLLVGCAMVYVLTLQDMKVGEHSYTVPTYYAEDGSLIPVETRNPTTLISLQGVNKEALAEWVTFTESYDPDLSIAAAADKAGQSDIPEQYRYTYGCYSQEMVDKLNEIVEKYDLKLLSPDVTCQSYASSALFGAMGIDGVCYPDAPAEIEYLSGYFYPEGTFQCALLFTLDSGDWPYGETLASFRYSRKDYFDPVTGSVGDPESYTQWTYTRRDGTPVLLALNDDSARIYADLPDAFLSIQMDSSVWDGEAQVRMSQGVLEQIAELFDLSITPHPAEQAAVEALLAEAEARYQAEQAAARESLYKEGYEAYIEQMLERYARYPRGKDNLTYALYDLNGDGVEELISCYSKTLMEILSLRDGESYSYFSTSDLPATPVLYVCPDNVMELYDTTTGSRYYFRAEESGASYLVGLTPDGEDGWYLLPEFPAADPVQRVMEKIDGEQAEQIIASHPRTELQRQLMKRYGEPLPEWNYTDPYAVYIAEELYRYDDADQYTYALLDMNGDGVEELIARDVWTQIEGKEQYILSAHTIKDGQRVNLNRDGGFNYLCQGGILECSHISQNGGTYYSYYQCTDSGMVLIDSIIQERGTLCWMRDPDGDGPLAYRAVTEEEVQAAIGSYKRIEPDWKPFTAYPFR